MIKFCAVSNLCALSLVVISTSFSPYALKKNYKKLHNFPAISTLCGKKHPYVRTYVHTYEHTYVHTRTHTHVRTYIRTLYNSDGLNNFRKSLLICWFRKKTGFSIWKKNDDWTMDKRMMNDIFVFGTVNKTFAGHLNRPEFWSASQRYSPAWFSSMAPMIFLEKDKRKIYSSGFAIVHYLCLWGRIFTIAGDFIFRRFRLDRSLYGDLAAHLFRLVGVVPFVRQSDANPRRATIRFKLNNAVKSRCKIWTTRNFAFEDDQLCGGITDRLPAAVPYEITRVNVAAWQRASLSQSKQNRGREWWLSTLSKKEKKPTTDAECRHINQSINQSTRYYFTVQTHSNAYFHFFPSRNSHIVRARWFCYGKP